MHSPIQLVTDSIASVNSIFLDALARCARERSAQFPLSRELAGAVGRMTSSDCRERGLLSLCLGEAHFADVTHWSRMEEGAAEADSRSLRGHWMLPSDRVLLAHSLFLVAWHGVRSMPSHTRILFGMSDEVGQIFQNTSFTAVFPLAQARSAWVYPRWPTRFDVWSSLVDAPIGDRSRVPSSTLRLMQASAGESLPMLSTAFLGSLQIDSLPTPTPIRSRSRNKGRGRLRSRKRK